MRDEIIEFSRSYDIERETLGFADPRSVAYNLMMKGIPEQIRDFRVIRDNNYLVRSSCGQGQWTFNPWICIFDPEVTSKASEGYYIVYLFDDSREHLFLTINQAWTPYKENKELNKTSLRLEAAELVARGWRKMISDEVVGLGGVDTIRLTNDPENSNALGYQVSHIWGFTYSLAQLPDDEKLKSDLETTVRIFKKLKIKINKSAPVNSITQILQEEKGNNDLSDFDLGQFKLTKVNVPDGVKKRQKSHTFKGRIIDHQKANEEKLRIGKIAEVVILNEEIKKLENYNSKNGTNLIPEWKSKTEGDGLGYDILSYDLEGNEILIEVKSTAGDKNEPFFLTSNELQRMLTDGSRYYIYRLYNLDIKNLSGEFFILHGDIQSKLDMEPSVYTCSIK